MGSTSFSLLVYSYAFLLLTLVIQVALDKCSKVICISCGVLCEGLLAFSHGKSTVFSHFSPLKYIQLGQI